MLQVYHLLLTALWLLAALLPMLVHDVPGMFAVAGVTSVARVSFAAVACPLGSCDVCCYWRAYCCFFHVVDSISAAFVCPCLLLCLLLLALLSVANTPAVANISVTLS
jgi:hypothetical protein